MREEGCRRQSLGCGLSRLQVAVDGAVEACYGVGVGLVAGDELAVVEAAAVAQQQVDGVAYDVFAVFVDAPAQLVLYAAQASPDDLLLAARYVERLVLAVLEEGVFLQPRAERGAAYEARVEDQHLAVVGFKVDGLTRGDEEQRAVGEVVGPPAVFLRVLGVVLEHHGVAVGLHPAAVAGRRHVDEAHQRVQRFGVEGPVTLAYVVGKPVASLPMAPHVLPKWRSLICFRGLFFHTGYVNMLHSIVMSILVCPFPKLPRCSVHLPWGGREWLPVVGLPSYSAATFLYSLGVMPVLRLK